MNFSSQNSQVIVLENNVCLLLLSFMRIIYYHKIFPVLSCYRHNGFMIIEDGKSYSNNKFYLSRYKFYFSSLHLDLNQNFSFQILYLEFYSCWNYIKISGGIFFYIFNIHYMICNIRFDKMKLFLELMVIPLT